MMLIALYLMSFAGRIFNPSEGAWLDGLKIRPTQYSRNLGRTQVTRSIAD
jgi:hypothetical protein